MQNIPSLHVYGIENVCKIIFVDILYSFCDIFKFISRMFMKWLWISVCIDNKARLIRLWRIQKRATHIWSACRFKRAIFEILALQAKLQRLARIEGVSSSTLLLNAKSIHQMFFLLTVPDLLVELSS